MKSQQTRQKLKSEISKLPDSPGVYFFVGKNKRNLYIGKATSLRDRVRSYFSGDILESRSPLIAKMLEEASGLKYRQTDSVLEALILEAYLIKKYQPPYNTDEKDNKSWNYVVISDEYYPQVLLVRGRELEKGSFTATGRAAGAIYGPFPHGGQLKEALKIIRKIFPFRDRKCKPVQGRPCFSRQIGLCPGVCTGEISKKDYAKTIRNLKLFFEGKKKQLVRSLEHDMKSSAKGKNFEEAGRIKKMIFALNHIQDVALLGNFARGAPSGFRIEAYDVAHLAGRSVVGVMTVVSGGQAEKSEYRKFKIKDNPGVNDTRALAEILRRRLAHDEWPLPRLIVVDGAVAQVNVAKKVLQEFGYEIPIVGVVKNERHLPKGFAGDERIAHLHEADILLANSEAHRFALKFHRDTSRKTIERPPGS